jgi:hypothetical protein
MNLRSIRIPMLATLALVSPLTVAASQSTGVHVPSKSEMQNRDGISRAV